MLAPIFAELLLLVLVLLTMVRSARAHSWTIDPLTYNTRYKTGDCTGPECGSPCPPKWRRHMNNSAASPAATYHRGQEVDISWVRNSHHGGMVRLGFVPVSAMWNAAAHSRLALFYGCWDDEKTRCKSRSFRWCGTDAGGFALTARLRVPTCLPDGDYVFAYAWFGGLHFRRNRGGFPDFNHCAHVRVRGGAAVGGACVPEFRVRGGPSASRDRTQCLTSATAPGQCVKRECMVRSFYAKPKAFVPNDPPPFFASDVAYVADHPKDTLPKWPIGTPDRGPHSAPPAPTGKPWQSPSRSPAAWRASPPPRQGAKCGGGVCCSPGCTKCAGRDCHKHGTNHGDMCCRTAVLRTGRSCDSVGPPCVCRNRAPKNCPKLNAWSPRPSPSGVSHGGSPSGVQCGSGVCCSPGCKGCGGADCHFYKTNPTQKCCASTVRKTGRSCTTHSAPCVCRQGRTKNCPWH